MGINRNERGRSRIEMLGVLAIIGVLSVGGIAGYSKAMMKYRVNKTIEQITLIANNLSTFYKNSFQDVTCWGDCSLCKGCPILKKAKLIPDEMVEISENKISKITNEFGGSVYLANDGAFPMPKGAYGFDGFSGYAYILAFQDVPSEACVDIITKDWSNLKSSGLVGFGTYPTNFTLSFENAIGFMVETSNRVRESYASTPKSILSFSIDEAVKGCTCANNVCQVYFGFYR